MARRNRARWLMSEWHPNGRNGLGLQSHAGKNCKIVPIELPDNPSEVHPLTIEADDEEDTITELGRRSGRG
jgi:hypothetical protein